MRLIVVDSAASQAGVGVALRAGELASLRGVLDASLPDTATITRPTLASDSQGGWTAAYASQGSADCRLSPRSALEAELVGKLAHNTDWILTVSRSTTIKPQDLLTIAAKDYEVVGVHDGRSWELCHRCELVQKDHGGSVTKA